MYIYIHIYVCIYAITKTMCPPGYHHNGFVAPHALEHSVCNGSLIYIYIYMSHIYIYIYQVISIYMT